MNYLTYPRVLTILQSLLSAGQVINVALAMNHGNWVVTACITAGMSGIQTYLHSEGLKVDPNQPAK